MLRTQISLDPQMYSQARKEALRRGISFAELCRRALAQLLEPKGGDEPWMRFAGSLASGDVEASRTVDEVVYVRERP